jgi:hypothetical protein
LAETLGPDATVSKSTVSQICKAIGEQFDAFRVSRHGYPLFEARFRHVIP